MTQTTQPTRRAKLADADMPYVTEAEAVARVAANPAEFDLFPAEERAAKHVALPEGWSLNEVKPEPPRLAPDRQEGTTTVLTAGGFCSLINEHYPITDPDAPVGSRTEFRLIANRTQLVGVLNPGTVSSAAYEDLRVILRPEESAELKEWRARAAAWATLAEWEQFVQDHALDIDAAAEIPGYVSGLDVLADAHRWEVEQRTASKRMRTEAGEADDKEEYSTKIIGDALAAFKIVVPILTHGEPFDLTIVIDRDLERQRIKPRIPTIQRVIDAAVRNEIQRAEETLGVEAIR